MALDPSIILGVKPPDIQNPLDVATKAMTLKSLTQRTQLEDRQLGDDQAVRSAYQKNTAIGPDGAPKVDQVGVMSDLMNSGHAPAAIQEHAKMIANQNTLLDQQLKTQTDRNNFSHQLSMSIPTDSNTPLSVKQAAWKVAHQQAIQAGLPGADQAPTEFPGDDFVKSMQAHTLSAKEQMDQANKDREFQQKDTELSYKHEENSIKRQQLLMDRDNKAAADLDKHLSLGWAGRSGQAGVVQGKINSAEAAEALLEQGKSQPGGLDSRQIEELAQSTSKLLGGGTQASARVDALVPKTAIGNAQHFKEWLTNNPTGADQQAFTNRMAETVAREKALATNQMRQFQIEGLPAFAGLKNRNPNLYNSILQGKGIDPSMIDSKGRYKSPAASSQINDHPQDAQAVQWAKANPKDPRSAAILKLNGAGQ